MNKPIVLSIVEIADVLQKARASTQQKASRQGWYFEAVQGQGRAQHFYPLNALPDEVQVAWAETLKSEDLSKKAFALPDRLTFYKRGLIEWDGKSRGLCPLAKEVLLKRFPKLAEIKPVQPTPTRPSRFKDNAEKQGTIDELKSRIAQIEGGEESREVVDLIYMEDVRAAAGGGALNPDYPIGERIGFSPALIKIMAPGIKLDGLRMIKVHGNSMVPDLIDGETVIIDQGDHGRTFYDGAIYVVRFEDSIYVKRLTKTPGSKAVKLLSANKDYEPIVVEGVDLESMQVIGQVVAKIRIDPM